MKKAYLFLTICFLLWSTVLSALATPTRLVIRAKAKDAKFMGSSIGGARIIVRDALSGTILAEGLTEGSTGNTERIMEQPHQRYQPLSDAETAAFTATLDIDKPILLTIEGYGPWQQPQARIKVQSQLWLIPGKDIEGDGLVLEFPGFIVNILSPQVHENKTAGNPIAVTANVVLMCGCPITAGGIWDAEQYEVQALVEKNGEPLPPVPLGISEKANTFTATLDARQPGLYQLTVYAYDPRTGNTGVASTNFIVR